MRGKRTSPLWAAVACALIAQGCASPGKPALQTIGIETPGCAQASCELRNDRGSWRLARAPGEVEVITSKAPLRVVCRAEDGAEGSAGASSSVSPQSGVGAVAGGVAGGAAVGAAFGTVALTFIPVLGVAVLLGGVAAGAAAGQAVEGTQREFGYPASISIPMSCRGEDSAAAKTTGTASFGVAVRGLPQAEARALGLGERGAVLVTNVAEGGRAHAAGLRGGDVVLAIDGREISDATDLEVRVLSLAPGSSLILHLRREGQSLELTLTLPNAAP